jgi:hypothetical protein
MAHLIRVSILKLEIEIEKRKYSGITFFGVKSV